MDNCIINYPFFSNWNRKGGSFSFVVRPQGLDLFSVEVGVDLLTAVIFSDTHKPFSQEKSAFE